MNIGTRLLAATAIGLGYLGGCATIRKYNPTDQGLRKSRQLTQEAQSQMYCERWDDAEAKLLDAVDRCPTNDQARRCLAEVLWNRGANLSAIEQLNKAMELSGRRDAATLIRIGTMEFAEGRLDKSLALANEALQAEPQSADAWALRGMVESQMGHPDTALTSFYRSLSDASDNRRTRMEIARIYRERNEPNRALAVLDAAPWTPEKLDSNPLAPESAEFHHLRGLIYRDLNRHADAVQALADAYEAGDSRPELLYLQADSQSAQGNFSAARALLTQVPEHQMTAEMWNLHQRILVADQRAGYTR